MSHPRASLDVFSGRLFHKFTPSPLSSPGASSSSLSPSEASSEGSSSEPSSALSSAPSSRPASPLKLARDPHDPPSFASSTALTPSSPILYLPPLLSSLPPAYAPAPPGPVPASARAAYLTTETRLPSIDPASLSLHKALHHFRPLTPEYAATPYVDAFNWAELRLPEDEEREWYCVAFRSVRKPGSESGPLYEADKLAHEEAIANGGLIMYWYGVPHAATGVNLATCVWQSRAHAIAANSRPHHIRAMRLAAASYALYDLERYVLVKQSGEQGVSVRPWESGPGGW